MEREDVKDELRELSEEGGSGGVLPAALLDIMEAGEKSAKIAEQNMAVLQGELSSVQKKSEKFTEITEQNMVTLQGELNNVQKKSEIASAEYATKTKGVLDGMQEKHDAFAAAVHKKLLWNIGLSAVAIIAVLVLLVMEIWKYA